MSLVSSGYFFVGIGQWIEDNLPYRAAELGRSVQPQVDSGKLKHFTARAHTDTHTEPNLRFGA